MSFIIWSVDSWHTKPNLANQFSWCWSLFCAATWLKQRTKLSWQYQLCTAVQLHSTFKVIVWWGNLHIAHIVEFHYLWHCNIMQYIMLHCLWMGVALRALHILWHCIVWHCIACGRAHMWLSERALGCLWHLCHTAAFLKETKIRHFLQNFLRAAKN